MLLPGDALPVPSQLAVLSPHPPDGQAPRAPCAATTEVWGDLPGRGSGLLVHPRCHRPGSPSCPSPLLCGPRTGLGALRTAQHGQVAAPLQLTHHQGGTCYPTAPCSIKSSAENPSHPLAAPGRSLGQLCPVSSTITVRGIQCDHTPHGMHEGTVLGPLHTRYPLQSQETCSCPQTTYAQGC